MEKRTERINMKILPSVKAMAEESAAADGRTLSNYIENLIKKDFEERRKVMEKYYYHNYARSMGGDYCEIYDENVNFVRTVKGVSKIENLQRITKRTDIATALLITEPLNDTFQIVKGHHKMTDEQIRNADANILGTRNK